MQYGLPKNIIRRVKQTTKVVLIGGKMVKSYKKVLDSIVILT